MAHDELLFSPAFLVDSEGFTQELSDGFGTSIDPVFKAEIINPFEKVFIECN
jgi:hypothetical protein